MLRMGRKIVSKLKNFVQSNAIDAQNDVASIKALYKRWDYLYE